MSTEIKSAFEAAAERVAALQRAGADPSDIISTHSDDVDAILVGVFDATMTDLGADASGVCLLALGGYGRRELTTGSDLDLMLLHRGWEAGDVADLNRRLMYPLWDGGRDLGDRVRDPKQAVNSIDTVDEAASLLDIRFLAGDRGLFAELASSVDQRMSRARARFFDQLRRASLERQERFGHAGHLLEPNIRDGAGGLRDIHTIGWAARLLPGGEGIDGLVAAGSLGERDGAVLHAARTFLLRVRIEAHLLTGRHQDQLYLAEQDEIAARLEYPAEDGHAPADALMRTLYRHARETDAVVSSFWERQLRRRPRRPWRSSSARQIGDGCTLRDGRVEVAAITDPGDDPAGWLRVFRQSVRHSAPVARATLARLHDALDATRVGWTPEARDVFLDILGAGGAAIPALEAMDATGLLPALVPDWEPIRGLPQRDLYHRLTVDMHLFAAVGEVASSRTSDEPDVRTAWAHVRDADAVLVATLLHDVAKGRGEDHSEAGEVVARATAERMGLPGVSVGHVAFLVREHLTLAMLATHRDLNDPHTIDELFQRVEGTERLAMLFLLTRADSLATGPEAWSTFRAALMRELFHRALAQAEGRAVDGPGVAERLATLAEHLEMDVVEVERVLGPMPEAWLDGRDPEAAARHVRLLIDPVGASEVRTSVSRLDEAYELIVVARDHPGLFSEVAGVLALRGIDVHDAEIYTRSDHVAVEVFRVIGSHGPIPDERWERVRADISAVLDGDLALDDALARKVRESGRRHAEFRRARDTRVVVSDDASSTHTVVEVHAADRLGLLRIVTKALADAGCDVTLAKVATYGSNVVDVFYVLDLDGHRIADADHQRRLRDAVTRAIDRTPAVDDPSD